MHALLLLLLLVVSLWVFVRFGCVAEDLDAVAPEDGAADGAVEGAVEGAVGYSAREGSFQDVAG